MASEFLNLFMIITYLWGKGNQKSFFMTILMLILQDKSSSKTERLRMAADSICGFKRAALFMIPARSKPSMSENFGPTENNDDAKETQESNPAFFCPVFKLYGQGQS